MFVAAIAQVSEDSVTGIEGSVVMIWDFGNKKLPSGSLLLVESEVVT